VGATGARNVWRVNIQIDNRRLDVQHLRSGFCSHLIATFNQFLGENFTEQRCYVRCDPFHIFVSNLQAITTILITLPVSLERHGGVFEPDTFINTEVCSRIGVYGGQLGILDQLHTFIIDGWKVFLGPYWCEG